MSVKAPSEKNFRRAKVRPGGKKGAAAAGWRAFAWRIGRWIIALLVVAYAGYRATTLVVHASGLQVRKIAVHGNVRISSGEVQAIVDGLRGSSILTADLVSYRRRLMESPWVADVALRRVLPSTVEVFVSERSPIGLCRLGSTLYLIDAGGTLIDEFGPQYVEFDLPIIDGLVRSPGSGQPSIDEGRAELAARVIESLAPRKDIAQKVSQIDVRDSHDAVVMLQDDAALLHLGEEKFLERLQSYVDLAPALRDQVREIDYVDLRFGERVYVRPAAKR
ncbi:MAG TPA: FtsQ-type POTRA domain-containing protein [Vicinamibacterales bacterium]|nr:FtsQ-type POTRA domain-containing protein [Vicinamibacterales bacterium]